MFGYIRPFKADLRVCENELYEALYCGICRDMRLRYGELAALAVSYDLVLLALLDMGLSGKPVKTERHRCPFHMIKGRKCARCRSTCGTGYSSDCGVILAYAKLVDDLRDGAPFPKLRAAVLLPLTRGYYKRAAKLRPNVARAVTELMEKQREAERSGMRSLDRLSEPTAAMLGAVFRELGGFDPELRPLLSGLGYMLGRYVYICDALDDIEKDIKNRDVNPFVPPGTKRADAALRRAAAEQAREAVNLTLGALAEYWSKLPESARDPMTDNIIYLGLRRMYHSIELKTLHESERKIKE